jgi:two-component system CheB/CheR fusion protein
MNLNKQGDYKNAEVAKRMNDQIDKLTELVNDLLDVTKIQKGQIQLNESDFDFDQLVEDIVVEQQMTARHKIIFNKSKIGKVTADRHRISQVMSNLISNAIKYSPDADEVVVSTQMKDDMINFSVKDFGIGIPEDKQHKVFEQYYRVSGTKEHTFPGLGLGLHLLRNHQKDRRKIYVHSVEGKGSDFCLKYLKLKYKTCLHKF